MKSLHDISMDGDGEGFLSFSDAEVILLGMLLFHLNIDIA